MCLPAQETQEMWVQEDPLEKETANHSSILAWEIPWTEEPGGHSPKGGKQLDTTEGLSTHTENWSWEEGAPLTANSLINPDFHKDQRNKWSKHYLDICTYVAKLFEKQRNDRHKIQGGDFLLPREEESRWKGTYDVLVLEWLADSWVSIILCFKLLQDFWPSETAGGNVCYFKVPHFRVTGYIGLEN